MIEEVKNKGKKKGRVGTRGREAKRKGWKRMESRKFNIFLRTEIEWQEEGIKVVCRGVRGESVVKKMV